MYETAEKSDFVCIRCNAQNEESSTFCFNCGYELDSNYCPNEFCDRNNGIHFPMPRTYCYCDSCGNDSTYLTEGFIEPQVFDRN